MLLRESQVQPLLLVCEDLHWIDTETQALLDTLVESLPTARLLLLVNYRPEYQHSWGSKTYYTQVRLDPLPPASADALLQALLGDDPSLTPLKRLLIARTEGNPFFLEESVRALVETGVLAGEPGAYRLTRPLPDIAVPATVQAVLAARIDRLPPDAKRLLQTAAVIGTEVPFPLLQTVAAMAPETLYRSLTQLQGAEFLYETHLFPERVHTFKHALTQNVAYQSLLTSTRQQVHRQIAQALESPFSRDGRDPARAAGASLHGSGTHEPAVAYWQRAGQRALARSAHLEAINHVTTGIELLKTLPDTPDAYPARVGLAQHPRSGVDGHQGLGCSRSRSDLHPSACVVSAGGRDPTALSSADGDWDILHGLGKVTDGTRAAGAAPQPGPTPAGADPPPARPPRTGSDLALAWRIGPGPRAPGAGDTPLRPEPLPLSVFRWR